MSKYYIKRNNWKRRKGMDGSPLINDLQTSTPEQLFKIVYGSTLKITSSLSIKHLKHLIELTYST